MTEGISRQNLKQKLIELGPLIAAGLLLLGGVAAMTAQFASKRTPEVDDWQRAAEMVVDLAEPTDGIRVHPTWTETPLPHLLPLGNLLHRQHRPLLEDFTRIEGVLILTESRRRQEAIDRLPFPAEPSQVHPFGTVEVLEVEIPEEYRLQSDLIDVLDQAFVYYGSDDGMDRGCRRWSASDRAWQCEGRNRGAMVGATLLEIEHDGRRCIQAFPPSDGRYLAVEVTVEDLSDVLRLRAGLDQRAARLQRGDDVIYRIYLDGEQLVEERVDGHSSRWTPHDFDMSQRLGDSVELRFEVESVVPTPHHRRFCFNAWSMTAEQAQRSNR